MLRRAFVNHSHPYDLFPKQGKQTRSRVAPFATARSFSPCVRVRNSRPELPSAFHLIAFHSSSVLLACLPSSRIRLPCLPLGASQSRRPRVHDVANARIPRVAAVRDAPSSIRYCLRRRRLRTRTCFAAPSTSSITSVLTPSLNIC